MVKPVKNPLVVQWEVTPYYGCDNRGNETPQYNLKGDWYAMVRYPDDKGVLVSRPVRRGINRVKDLKAKIEQMGYLVQAVRADLQAGWNPLTDKFERDEFEELRNKSIADALWIGLELKLPDLREDTSRKAYVANIKLWQAVFTELYSFPIKDLRQKHIYKAWDKLRDDREKETGKRYGNTRHLELHSTLRSVLKKLVRKEVFDTNPAADMELPKKARKGKVFVPHTDAERVKIAKWTKEHDFRFYVLLKLIFRAYIRPVEILRLKPPDFDLDNGFIRILDTNAKNGETAYVPIDADLTRDLRKLGIEKTNETWYVFGAGYKEDGLGFGNRSALALEPSPVKLVRNRLSEHWNVTARFIGVSKKMYALKHTGANARMKITPDEIPSNLSPEAMLKLILEKLNEKTTAQRLSEVSKLMRHADEGMTRIYTDVDQIQLDQSIKDNYADF